MPTCTGCDHEFDPAELVRHETERLVVVHCPSCSTTLGRYRRHGQRSSRG